MLHSKNVLTSVKVNNKIRQLLEKRAEVGCNAEYGSNVVRLEMPFFIDQDRFAPFKNDYRYPHLKIHKIAPLEGILSFIPRSKTQSNINGQSLKSRDWRFPMVSMDAFQVPVTNQRDQKQIFGSFTKSSNHENHEILQLLLNEAIYSSKPLGHINISTEWKLGITATGTRNRRNDGRKKDALDNNFRRVAIKRFVIDGCQNENKKENKFLIWCLDEVKNSLQWVDSTGPIYELPDSLKPEVFPWLAMHIWYDKQIMNHPERLQKIMELYYENESHIDSIIAEQGFHISAYLKDPMRSSDWLMTLPSDKVLLRKPIKDERSMD